MRTSVLAPYAAYLRVYEPLAAFAEPERSTWTRYVSAPARRSMGELKLLEHGRGLRDLLATPPVAVPPHESDDAFVQELDGVTLVCPRQGRLRSWTALAQLRREYPSVVVDGFWPRVVVDQAMADFDRWRAGNPDAQPHIRTSTWHVPLAWFVLFVTDERVEVPPVDDDPFACAELYYRTPMVQARRRVARALRVLRDTLEEGGLTAGVEQLGRWLEEFHPRSLVELDYGGLPRLIGDDGLAAERSVEDVAEGLAALRAQDGPGADAAYRRFTERWRVVRALEHAS